MNIALVILHADPSRGGAERYTIDLAIGLGKRGHDVRLFCSTFTELGCLTRPGSLGFREVVAPARGLTKLSRYGNFLDDLDRHLAANTYDVVHAMLPVRRCDVYHPHAGVAAEAIRSGHTKHPGAVKRSVAAVFNRVNVKRNWFARVERKLLTSPDPPVVLCLSEYVKATVRRHYPGLPEDRLSALFNAVNLARFDPATPPHRNPEDAQDSRRMISPPPGTVLGLMVAQDFERKGLREAITALSRADQPNLRLAVVGKPDPTPYRELARSLGVEARVEFLGTSPYVYDWYAAADFFVLPTRHDPCSLVVLEALAMGLPVISTRQNGATEIMTQWVHGYVLDSADDLEGLTRAMRALCDPTTRQRMRAACLELRPRLAYETHLATLESIYARVARSDKRS